MNIIEWLKFKVPEKLRETFIQKEAEIWTPVVMNYPGFVSKEIWINPQRNNRTDYNNPLERSPLASRNSLRRSGENRS